MDLREEMIGLVEEFNNCGMTQIAFCNSKGISFHKFNHWFRKLKKGKKGEMERHQFVQVDTKPVKKPKTPKATTADKPERSTPSKSKRNQDEEKMNKNKMDL